MKNMTAADRTQGIFKLAGTSKTALLRLGLMVLIAVCAVMLQGADHPEKENKSCTLSEAAVSLCRELAPELRPEMEKAASQNPVWVLQVLAE